MQVLQKNGMSTDPRCRGATGITGSKDDQYSYAVKALTNEQENVLVRYINDLSAKGLPPTSQIVKNLAEELKDIPIQRIIGI
jgi:hypothetical protein